jgi:hypothetical protein
MSGLRWPIDGAAGEGAVRTRGRALLAASAVLGLGLALACAGCAVIPVREEVLAGNEIAPDMLGFVRFGVTTRDSIVAALGPPTIEFPDVRTIAYPWQARWAKMPWIIPFGGAGVQDLGRTHVLLFAFDPRDRVLAFDLERRQGGTIRTHALRWIERERLDVPRPPSRFVSAPIPAGEARLYVYRRGGWKDAKGLAQPAVSVDGRLVAELRKGAFVSVLLAPGAHDLTVDPVPDVATKTSPPATRPIETITIQAVPDTTYYVELWIRFGWGALDPALQPRAPRIAEPVIRKMKPTW